MCNFTVTTLTNLAAAPPFNAATRYYSGELDTANVHVGALEVVKSLISQKSPLCNHLDLDLYLGVYGAFVETTLPPAL